MKARFWYFDKRKNSTKIPDGAYAEIEVRLKDNVDIDNPVFIMHNLVTRVNYMYWDGSYYFIVGRKYIGNETFEITCEIDALATCKSQIKESTQYVTRSNVLPDYSLIDNFYPTFHKPTIYQASGSTMNLSSSGSYVLITKSGNGVQYFGLTSSEFRQLLSTLMAEKQEDLWAVIADAGQTILPSLLNVMDYIIACKWVPFPVQSGSSTQINLGWWPSGVSAVEYAPTLEYSDTTEPFSLHVRSGAKEFMNCSQFHRVSIYVPGCGEFPVEIAKCKSSLNVAYRIDALGNVVGSVASGSGGTFDVVARFSGALGKDVPLSQSQGTASGVAKLSSGVGSLVSAGIGIATGGMSSAAAAGMALGGAMNIGSGIQSSIADISTKGGVDSYALPPWGTQIMCTEVVYDIPTQQPNLVGYPCMKSLTLSSDGYYQIANPQVDFGDDLHIKDKIIEYMQGGFYIE